jgi:hypothetical protein
VFTEGIDEAKNRGFVDTQAAGNLTEAVGSLLAAVQVEDF